MNKCDIKITCSYGEDNKINSGAWAQTLKATIRDFSSTIGPFLFDDDNLIMHVQVDSLTDASVAVPMGWFYVTKLTSKNNWETVELEATDIIGLANQIPWTRRVTGTANEKGLYENLKLSFEDYFNAHYGESNWAHRTAIKYYLDQNPVDRMGWTNVSIFVDPQKDL